MQACETGRIIFYMTLYCVHISPFLPGEQYLSDVFNPLNLLVNDCSEFR